MASKIDPAQAKSLIEEFRNQNKASSDPLKTQNGEHLNGFFLNRESLESILKDPEVAGIHVHFAKHPDFAGKPDNVQTLMYSGSIQNTEAGAAHPSFLSRGETFEPTAPCPPWCTK